MAMKPRDPLEMMLAGQCIIFDHLLNTAVLDLSPDRPEPARTKARPGIVAAARMFHNSLNALRRAQSGTAEKTSRPREVIQAVEPRTVAPAPAAAKPPTPRFVCQRVHIPRQREASNDVRFGAMYRPPNSQIRNMSRTTQSGLLNGASRIAMPIPSAAKRALSLDELPLSILEPTLSREQRRARPAPRKRR
jgi:hypothetical protein